MGEAERGQHAVEHALRVLLRLGEQRALLGRGLDLLLGDLVHLLLAVRVAGEEVADPVEQALLLGVHVRLVHVELSRYEAASGQFQVVVDITKHEGILPGFLAGSETLFIGQGTDIAYVDFGGLKGSAIVVSPSKAVTVKLPKAQLEPAVLNVSQSYVYAEQQGVFNRIGNFFSGNPNSQQQAYELAEQKIETAAKASTLVKDAETNTRAMLVSMLNSLGFQQVSVTFDLEHALAPRL